MHPAAQKGFSLGAELISKFAPVIHQKSSFGTQDQLKVGESSTVIDLGSGTGKFYPYLIQTQAKVIMAEPCDRDVGTTATKLYITVECLQTSSEQLLLKDESVNAIICAQSFHWFSNIETLKGNVSCLNAIGASRIGLESTRHYCGLVKSLADEIAPFEADTPRYHSEKWKQVLSISAISIQRTANLQL